MKTTFRIITTTVISSLCFSVAHANQPTTFLGPTAQGRVTSPLTEVTAYSLAAEAGLKNYRVGGSLGWRMDLKQRLKVSLEYLWQDITYSFFSGNTNQWVNQGAIGADYQYLFSDYAFRPAFNLAAYYSHAPSKTLGTNVRILPNSFGIAQTLFNARRIAGSNAGGVAPGVSIQPWVGGNVGVDLNYDIVSYNKNFRSNQNDNGFGGTIRLSQTIFNDFTIGGAAAFREPFNNYDAYLTWSNIPYLGNWRLGLNGDYTSGKNSLPSSYNVGVSVDYFMDMPCMPIVVQKARLMNLKGDYKGEVPVPSPVADDFLAWTADPAVYMPQVLAVPDQRVRELCTAGLPLFFGSIASLTIPPVGATTLNAGANFSGNGLLFSVTTTPALAPGDSLTITPTAGVIVATLPSGAPYSVVVTARNQCGVATSNAFTLNSLVPL